MILLVYCLLSYLLGAIPFGFVIAKAMGVDILSAGSQNIGATNVHRVLGKGPGILVLLLDILKGFLPPLLVPLLHQGPGLNLSAHDWGVICGALGILGHTFSIFLGFKGGKGIATGVGCMLAVHPNVGALALLVFFILMAVTRLVSLSSLLATASMLVFAVVFHEDQVFMIVFSLVTVIIFVKHKKNIERLLKGEETKFKFKSKQEESQNSA